ncbi:YtfJ family protein [Oceanisphaera sp.]|uniref:YtfJ family protein n=1 Tax=Oceanisphaera sp. TaxID=1929979 RepID=UPI003A8F71B2
MSIRMGIFLACLPFITSAHNLTLHQAPPAVAVTSQGELLLMQDQLSARPWQLSDGQGKVRLVQHIAGRSSAKELNAPLIEAIKAAQLPRDHYQTVTIINVDDALFGTSGFVRSSAESSKREFPWSSIVVDNKGEVAQKWQLTARSSAIILLDKEGRVLFTKEGALAGEQIKDVLKLIQTAL